MILVSGWIMSLGINRYIVGCKYLDQDSSRETRNRINRYIVGCKLSKFHGYSLNNTELIDT